MLQEKQLLKDSPEHFFVAGMDKYLPTSLVVPECPTPLLGRDILTKLGTTLVMGSFSAPEPYSFWLLLKNPLHLLQ